MCEPGAPDEETERTFVGQIPDECLVAAGTGAPPPAASIRVWTAAPGGDAPLTAVEDWPAALCVDEDAGSEDLFHCCS